MGINSGAISEAYATGAVYGGTFNIGGLAGGNSGTITDAYATGAVSNNGGPEIGGLVGSNFNLVSNGYWDTETSGTTVGLGADFNANAQTVTGLTTAELTAALPGGLSSSIWGNVNNRTTPYLLALTGNPQTVYIGDGSEGIFHLLFTMGQLQDINASSTTLQGNYALANALDAATDPTTPADWTPLGTDGAGLAINGGHGFAGIFDGFGNTISNLTVDTGSNGYAGLFGYLSGTIRNVGVVGGSVSGGSAVGGLVGDSESGTITDAFAADTVDGGSGVGGLVGVNNAGTVSQAYASGAVTSSSDTVGGLVGNNSGAISEAYATGAVTGSSDYVGGLVGINNGSISDAFATGVVTDTGAGIYVGGLGGLNFATTVSNAYWDTETTGKGVGFGYDFNHLAVHGLTTAGLSGALPAGLSASIWGNASNQTTPYLLNLPGPVYVGSDASDLFWVIQNVNALQAINTDLSRNYVLANDIDASATAGWDAGRGLRAAGHRWSWHGPEFRQRLHRHLRRPRLHGLGADGQQAGRPRGPVRVFDRHPPQCRHRRRLLRRRPSVSVRWPGRAADL